MRVIRVFELFSIAAMVIFGLQAEAVLLKPQDSKPSMKSILDNFRVACQRGSFDDMVDWYRQAEAIPGPAALYRLWQADEYGHSPLYYAALKGDLATLRWLIAKNPASILTEYKAIMQAPDRAEDDRVVFGVLNRMLYEHNFEIHPIPELTEYVKHAGEQSVTKKTATLFFVLNHDGSQEEQEASKAAVTI